MTKKANSSKAQNLPKVDESLPLLEKILAFGFIASVAVSVLAILVILLAAFSNGAWIPVGLGLVPMLALPFGFLCLAGLLIASSFRKRKSSKN
jgi:hydrogenase-4 membrane subunit HyfE